MELPNALPGHRSAGGVDMTDTQPCLRQVFDQLVEMENHWRSVSEYVGMLVILTAQPDAESAMDGIHRLLHQIDDHATAVGEHWEAAWAAVCEPRQTHLVTIANQ